MYRRLAYEEIGGYRKSIGPEDHNLFYRMIERGWKAILCPEFLLEYRQHSNEQACTHLTLGLELAFLRRQLNVLNRQLNNLVKEKFIIQEVIKQVAIFTHQNKIDEAINIIRQTFRRFPEHGKLLLQYAILLRFKGFDEEARSILDSSILFDANLIEYKNKFKREELHFHNHGY